MFFIVGQAEPLVDNEHAGTGAGHGVIVGNIAFEGRIALLVSDGFGHNFGRGGHRTGDGEQKRQNSFHGVSLTGFGPIANAGEGNLKLEIEHFK